VTELNTRNGIKHKCQNWVSGSTVK